MMALCPSCWRTLAPDATQCPHCGADIQRLHERAFREKLLGALSHPDRDTVVRSILILAARGDPEAPDALERAIRRFASEPHVVAALLDGLAFLPAADAQRLVRDALAHPSCIVRRAAARLLEQIDR
jgi:hypothetical protein